MRGERRCDILILAAITLAGLALRLVVWEWRELQGLGGDEQEYLSAAVTLLRDRRYTELLFMRPPLYPVFLAASIYVVDSLVQNLRLVQALVSAATVPLVYLLTLEVARWGGRPLAAAGRWGALAAAALCALSYTLAANAAELLTETLFLFGLSGTLWLLLRAARLAAWPLAALAGLALGALCLVRSVGLPLLPLGALWLAVSAERRAQSVKRLLAPAGAFALATLLVVLPWTARNFVTYGGLILIDTTGAENLWLDNDPAGREAVKAELFAMGEDRLARQQLASRRGLEVILADPGRFVAKAWGELLKFFALEQADDMLARPAIWVSPAETWARLILGDGLWLLTLLAGGYGLALGMLPARPGADGQAASGQVLRSRWLNGALRSARYALRSPAWPLGLWSLYLLVTTLIFHVELRYRLPLYPALLPYAGLVLAGGLAAGRSRAARLAAAVVPAAFLALTLLHAPYPALAWGLGWKHWHLGRAEMALAAGDPGAARRQAEAALARDEGSALARIALARAALAEDAGPTALAALDAAVAAVPDHPQAHVLRGDVRRALGDLEGARDDLAYEPATRQDLQRWLWGRAATPAPRRLDLGDGLDLGFLRGWHAPAPGDEGRRWTTGRAELRLLRGAAPAELALRLASGWPAGSAPVPVEVWAGGEHLATLEAGPEWAEAAVPLPGTAGGGELTVELRSPTFTPREFDRASPDGRRLGVVLDWAEVR